MRKSLWMRLLSVVLCSGLLIPAVFAVDEPEVKNVVIDAPAESWSMYDRSDNISDFPDGVETPEDVNNVVVEAPEGSWSIPDKVDNAEYRRATQFSARFDVVDANTVYQRIVNETYKYLAGSKVTLTGSWTPTDVQITFWLKCNSDSAAAYVTLSSGDSKTVYLPSTGTYSVNIMTKGGSAAAGSITISDG